MQATEPCKTDCKFCIIHEYGVYVVNSLGIFMLMLILIVYRREVFYHCSSRRKSLIVGQSTTHESPLRQLTIESPLNYKSALIVNEPTLMTPMSAQPPVIYQQPILTPPKIEIQVMQSTMKKQPPESDFLNQWNDKIKTKQPPINLAPTTVKIVDKQLNVNRSSSPSANTGAFEPHESTGSNYFKQMMQGKRPVASISQYLLNKHKRVVHEKKDVGNKRRHIGRTNKK